MSGTGLEAAKILTGRDAMVSYAAPTQIDIAAEVCRSVVLDNGAFTYWSQGQPVKDWRGYYRWAEHWLKHPSVMWAVIPDVIDGDERANEALIDEWPLGARGVPVWHLHETTARLVDLGRRFPLVALGSSGQYAQTGTQQWWQRMNEALNAICDEQGHPRFKLHGLRMLDPTIMAHVPLTSADSTNVARNIGMDTRWHGPYAPKSREVRAQIIMDRIESHAKAARWAKTWGAQLNFELLDCSNV